MTCTASCTHPRTRLVDGSETCTWSNAWRHECEARMVAHMPTLLERRRYLLAIRDKRGEAAWLELRRTVEAVWNAERASPAGGG